MVNSTIGNKSFAEGGDTTASGYASHAEGDSTIASSYASHTEGVTTTASNDAAHAEGISTTASGYVSHTEGEGTIAAGNYQHVQGKYNISDASGNNAVYADIIGNGTENTRKNIEATTWTGDKRLKGDVYVGCNDDSTGGTKLVNYHRNLLDNPYFKIDQRKGYIVPSGTTYYSSGWVVVGTIDRAYKVTNIGANSANIIVNGTTYDVSLSDMVRGYCGYTYGFDMWKDQDGAGGNSTVTKNNDGTITITNNNSSDNIWFEQFADDYSFMNGRTFTLSVNLKQSTGTVRVYCGNTYFGDLSNKSEGIYTFTKDITTGSSYLLNLVVGAGASITLKATNDCAFMLEEGIISTLEAEIARGAYDESADLLKCRKYQKVYEFGNGVHIDTQITDSNGMTWFNFPIENPRTDRGTWVWLSGDINKLRVHNNTTHISSISTSIGESGSCRIEGGKALLRVTGLTPYTTYTLDYYSSDGTRCKLLADFNI